MEFIVSLIIAMLELKSFRRVKDAYLKATINSKVLELPTITYGSTKCEADRYFLPFPCSQTASFGKTYLVHLLDRFAIVNELRRLEVF
jgi:hypothetical protein